MEPNFVTGCCPASLILLGTSSQISPAEPEAQAGGFQGIFWRPELYFEVAGRNSSLVYFYLIPLVTEEGNVRGEGLTLCSYRHQGLFLLAAVNYG